MNISKIFKNAILRLYRDGIYTVDYALIQAEALRSRNRINEADYEELIVYLAAEQEKQMTIIEEPSQDDGSSNISAENSENTVENTADSAENTTEN